MPTQTQVLYTGQAAPNLRCGSSSTSAERQKAHVAEDDHQHEVSVIPLQHPCLGMACSAGVGPLLSLFISLCINIFWSVAMDMQHKIHKP